MKSTRINLCTSVREMLAIGGISTVKVVDAINSALARLEAGKSTSRLGTGSVTKSAYSVTETESVRWTGQRNVALDFDAFNSKVESIEKRFGQLSIASPPECFKDWLEKMKIPAQKETEKENVSA